MALFDRINEDLKKAMLAKDQGALRAIRAIKAAMLLAKTDGGKEITPEDEVKLVQKLVKQRKDSIEIYLAQNRKDLADTEKEELDVIEKYLPAQISIDELRLEILEIIKNTNAVSLADISKVMPLAMKSLGAKSDGKTISEEVKRLLSNQ
jgi:uncharacterized protein